MQDAVPVIRILDTQTARKIAAGEVIERPASAVRELLDNSLDAESRTVDLTLASGGTGLIRVVDDGGGMSRADLELCWLAHATSKIASADDLERVRSLGFRGEALSSIAAVSRLTVTSAPRGGAPSRLRVEGGKLVSLDASSHAPGTSVEVADLFYNVPARRQFQKHPGAENAASRAVFLERSLAFPDVAFRLTIDGRRRDTLAPDSLIGRITSAYPEHTEPALLQELRGAGPGFTLTIVAGEPVAARGDRKQLMVFVNRRRVWEYALVQAVEYAYRDYLRGGFYPVAYLFLEAEPQLVDFNIHPAKREVRFRNLPEVHRRSVALLGAFLRTFDRRALAVGEALPFVEGAGASVAGPPPAREAPLQTGGHPAPSLRTAGDRSGVAYDLSRTLSLPRASVGEDGFRYVGQVMGLFLVVDRGDTLVLVDQHAAHERVIYDRLRNGCAGQELLFPVPLELDPGERTALEDAREILRRLGIEVQERDDTLELVSMPSNLGIEADALAHLLAELLHRPEDLERELYASLACRSAVTDGDLLPPETAEQIIREVLTLQNAACPHGRPIWVEFPRSALETMVGRSASG